MFSFWGRVSASRGSLPAPRGPQPAAGVPRPAASRPAACVPRPAACGPRPAARGLRPADRGRASRAKKNLYPKAHRYAPKPSSPVKSLSSDRRLVQYVDANSFMDSSTCIRFPQDCPMGDPYRDFQEQSLRLKTGADYRSV